MKAQTSPGEHAAIFAANRARGLIDISVAPSAGRTRRQRVIEEGSLRIRFPNVAGPESEAVIVNTAGGIAGGDDFALAVTVAQRAQLAITTAAAEKVYRAIDKPAHMRVRLRVAGEGRLRWLPQEMILFDQARLHRSIEVDLDEEGALIMAEAVVLGRSAMQESVQRGEMIDRWRVRRDGRLVFAETLRLQDNIQALLARLASGNGAVAFATIIIAPGAETQVDAIRQAMQHCTSEAGVSAWNGIAVVRLCATNAAILRRDLVLLLNATGASLPRLWIN